MDISRMVVPRLFISSMALLYVRSVVPNPGIVTAIISLWSFFRMSKEWAVTSRASVESSPPEIPITHVVACACSIRLASPDA